MCVCVCTFGAGRTILELLVWDLDDLASYTLPEDDIEFNDPSDQFDHRIDGNTVVITVSTSSLSFGVSHHSLIPAVSELIHYSR